ncbi:hypothetical protein [Dendronalium sp. ChiSLP03b]|nr:hypothetical protein [Dendronalium sp. ChiSLP03b]MDZ8207682.1 hypothetical protein [Dendronalium sp. ChiSLP03b]
MKSVSLLCAFMRSLLLNFTGIYNARDRSFAQTTLQGDRTLFELMMIT